MSGGGGTQGGSTAGLYLPPGQDQAAAQYSNLLNPLYQQGQNAFSTMGGVSPAQWAYPQVQASATNILQNPYSGLAIQGAGDAQNIYQNQMVPNAFNAGGQLQSLGNQASASAPYATNAFTNPLYTAADQAGSTLGAGYANDVSSMLNMAFQPPQYASGVTSLISEAMRPTSTSGSLPAYMNELMRAPVTDSALPSYLAEAMKTPEYMGAGQAILQSSMDPQSALYNRTRQQVMDQTGASLASSGLGQSPYGASVAGNVGKNFNIDWQNSALSRMISGSQAAKTIYDSPLQRMSAALPIAQGVDNARLQRMSSGLPIAQGLDNAQLARMSSGLSSAAELENAALARTVSGVGAAEGLGTAALDSYLRPAQSRASGTSVGAGALGSLASTADSSYTGGQNLYSNLASIAPTAMGAPYNTYNAIQNAGLGALQNEIGLGNNLYGPANQAMTDLSTYLKLGQTGSQIASQVGNTNFNQGLSTASGIGNLLGLGGSGGGLGSLIGSTGSTGGSFATDAFGLPVELGSQLATDVGGGSAGSGLLQFLPSLAASA